MLRVSSGPAAPLLQIAFLTGQSVPGTCALSPVQADFLARLVANGGGVWSAIDCNFPFVSMTTRYRRPSILSASLANAWQYFASRRPAFGARHRPALTRLIEGAPRTILLAGSCGLELFANAGLPAACLDRCRILAYGPAARCIPAERTEVVVGGRDWVSPLLFRCFPQVRVHRLDCDHLGYLQDPRMFALALDFVRRVAAELDVSVDKPPDL